MFWIVAAAITALVTSAILAPIRRAKGGLGSGSEPAAAYDLRVYRDQLTEVERDLERGVIQPEDAVRLRTEIGRKVLEADRRLSQAAPATGRGGTVWAAAVLGIMLAGGIALYLREGVPGAPDMPLAERFAAADAAYRARPAQAEAEAAATPRTAPDLSEADPDYLAMVDQLRAAVARNPDDLQGQQLLATHELRLGNLAAARDAQARLVALQGDQADAGQLMQLASLMVEAAGGLVTPEAEALLARALALDPSQPQARYLQGVMLIQNGRPDRAFPVWRRLLEEGPENAPWIPSIRAAIIELAWLAGDDEYEPPAPVAALPGPDAEALALAEDMTPEERQEMVEGMVGRLQDRLATEGGAPEEWAQLIGSLRLLGRDEQADAILDEARQRFAEAPEALAVIEAPGPGAGEGVDAGSGEGTAP
ncbi:c-type cytochrome biogenesis protein CcmI [Paracoccus liaowanqingii]|uniref:C-type cytochrome biogenesis protein CcmI n=1 Tax=Paracoccus liaowanqingii TaxID=2560053 RepID=A0A4P7HKU5_9RHOB|nr:c-type cytochrome biogenesis protein CcmI [Paracoccus liaowanqingii]QBX33711.1 c-type cytochrome biogenesis protein CcmI [Paracoccus liaowanqingii]